DGFVHAEEAYEEVYEAAPFGFYTLDRRGRITGVNEKGARILGFPGHWLRGHAFVVFVAQQYVHLFLEMLTLGVRTSQPQSMNLDLNIGNRILPVQITVSTSTALGVVHRMTLIELTNIKATEQLLRESLANWYSLVQNAPDVIMTIEKNGRI